MLYENVINKIGDLANEVTIHMNNHRYNLAKETNDKALGLLNDCLTYDKLNGYDDRTKELRETCKRTSDLLNTLLVMMPTLRDKTVDCENKLNFLKMIGVDDSIVNHFDEILNDAKTFLDKEGF